MGAGVPLLPHPPDLRRRPAARGALATAAAAALTAGALVGLPHTARAADPPPPVSATITLTMDYFERFEVPDDGIDEEGEFAPEVFIGDPATGGGGGQRGGVVSDDHFHPKNLTGSQRWVFSQRVTMPEGRRTLPITVRMWDVDDFLNFGGDKMDISPVNQDIELNLTYDILTDTWSGDSLSSREPSGCIDHEGNQQGQVCAIGDGDPNFEGDGNGKRAQLGLTIVSEQHSDADGDGLSDRDERFGIRYPDDVMAVDLPAYGADPLHKDLFLELDYSDGMAPPALAVEAVRTAFRLAPLPNPSGGPGLNLHVDSGGLWDKGGMERTGGPARTCNDGTDNDGVDGADGADPDCYYRDIGVEDFIANCNNGTDDDHDGKSDRDDPDCVVGEDLGGGNQLGHLDNCGFGDVFNQAKGSPGHNFNAMRARAFNYVIYTRSSAGCDRGGQGSGTDIILYRTDGGALLHELGHNLGLGHGGHEDANCKPNYVSLMNYDINSGIPRTGGGLLLDFSPPRIDMYDGASRHAAPLPKLKEDDLYEDVAQDPGDAQNQYVFLDGMRTKRTVPLNALPDWNGDNPGGNGDDGHSRQKVNIDNTGADDCHDVTKNSPATDDSELTGSDDWKTVLAYLPNRFPRPGAAPPAVEAGTFPTAQQAARILAVNNTTDLTVGIADSPDPVGAGESVTWTVTVTNQGPNSSTSTEVVTTLPADVTDASTSVPCTAAGHAVTCNLSEVRPGGSRSYTITAKVPANLVYANGGPKTIAATAKVRNLAGPDSNGADNTATAQTTVIAKADVKITSAAATSPLEVLIGQPGAAALQLTVENGGPSSPVDAKVTVTATGDPGVTVTPASATTVVTALATGTPRQVGFAAQLSCTAPGVKTVTLTATIAPANAADVDPDPSNNTRATTFRIDCVVPIVINVRPGSTTNPINLNTDANLAALTTTAGEYGLPLAFDATTIDVSTARWGLRENLFNTANPAGAAERHGKGHPERSYELDEQTRDADTDLVLHFRPSDSGLTATTTSACLKGKFRAADGNVYTFLGCDTVHIVP
ncbi:CARDB domain-containing protein [Dactylosporangium sp. AC04546]|uniref:CARDB domain-containing protein n=1 Tax=Dactylosporangium sp. AC04546 TaxID=2862460 RepID=UPI001EDFD1A6|nr:CARDB domain-containing protein [Dactylosporangium sp. AC04546]WVK88757.1 CARDB domain-containing protein [Dactylosporangium sp. AC04546]